MKYKATTSFSGIISMAMGEIREISDPPVEQDLLKAGYIVSIEEEKEKKTTKTVPKKGVKQT